MSPARVSSQAQTMAARHEWNPYPPSPGAPWAACAYSVRRLLMAVQAKEPGQQVEIHTRYFSLVDWTAFSLVHFSLDCCFSHLYNVTCEQVEELFKIGENFCPVKVGLHAYEKVVEIPDLSKYAEEIPSILVSLTFPATCFTLIRVGLCKENWVGFTDSVKLLSNMIRTWNNWQFMPLVQIVNNFSICLIIEQWFSHFLMS